MKALYFVLALFMSLLLKSSRNESLTDRLSAIEPYVIHEENIEDFKERLLRAKTWSEDGTVVYTMIEGDGTRGARLFIEDSEKLYMVEKSDEETESYAVYEIDEKNKCVRFLIEFKRNFFLHD